MAVCLLLAFAGIATAHTPNVSLTCEHGLKVNLGYYNDGGTNTVGVWIDDVAVDGSPFSFGASYSNTWSIAPATSAHTAKVVISAWDDPQRSQGWSRTYDLSMEACQQPTDEPTLTPTDEPTLTPTDEPTLTPTGQPTVAPTSTPKPIGTVEGNTGVPEITPPPTDTLGNTSTGTGSGLPLILAAVAALILAVLFVTPARKRSSR